jgi:hypothetical protein
MATSGMITSYLYVSASAGSSRVLTFPTVQPNGVCTPATFTGTGNGTINSMRGTAASLVETWTVTASSPTAFNVVGSLLGFVGSATPGTVFNHARVSFLITSGIVPFAVNDAFVFTTTLPPAQNVRIYHVDYYSLLGGVAPYSNFTFAASSTAGTGTYVITNKGTASTEVRLCYTWPEGLLITGPTPSLTLTQSIAAGGGGVTLGNFTYLGASYILESSRG